MTVEATSELTLRPITPDEFADFHRFTEGVFLTDAREEERDAESWVFEYDRSIGIFESASAGGALGTGRVAGADRPVASAAAYTRNLTVPGGPLPAAGVTWVAVAPTHRRRGLLSRMMRHQLTELHEQEREPVAVLWAAEAAIYGRFGYGAAARQADLSVQTTATALRRDVDRGDGRIGAVEPRSARPVLEAVYEAARVHRVGYLDRRDRWWDMRLFDPEHQRNQASALRCLLHEDAAGRSDGYALYSVKSEWRDNEPAGEVRVRELVATDPRAYAALCGHLLEMDLVRTVNWWCAGIDEPLTHLVTNPGGLRRRVFESLWVRLVDVDRALAARCYAAPVDVVLQVEDEFCPWNSGRYRLAGDSTGANCAPTTDPADLVVPASALGAAYLGGPTLAELAAAGQVSERRGGALDAASQAFRWRRLPAAIEVF